MISMGAKPAVFIVVGPGNLLTTSASDIASSGKGRSTAACPTAESTASTHETLEGGKSN